MAASGSVDYDQRPYDFIVYGASGFTGQYVVEELARVAREETPALTWAVAGRNEKKIREVLKNVEKYTGLAVENNTAIIIADVGDAESLDRMAKQCRLVINCIGPYWIYGEPVVKACIANGTHHIDISGEPQFVEKMQVDYHAEAAKNKCYVVGACGFDSIPTEMAVQYLQENFAGDLNSVEGYIKLKIGRAGMKFNIGTLVSACNIFADRDSLVPLREKLFTEKLPVPKHPLKQRSFVFYNRDTGTWCAPVLNTDPDVSRRTQYHNYLHRRLRPVQVGMYAEGPSLPMAVAYFLAFWGFMVTSFFALGRYLTEKFPGLMTLGMFSATGATREQIKGTSVKLTYVGKGYAQKLAEPSDQHQDEPDKTLILEIRAPEPGYDLTPIVMVQSAVLIVRQMDKLPGSGGVYTAGVAFRDTDMIDRLKRHRMSFELRNGTN